MTTCISKKNEKGRENQVEIMNPQPQVYDFYMPIPYLSFSLPLSLSPSLKHSYVCVAFIPPIY